MYTIMGVTGQVGSEVARQLLSAGQPVRAVVRSAEKARELFDYAYERLAYYKAPGWVYFLDELPVTGTQKIQKHMIFGDDQDPREMPDVYDMRPLKKR